MTRIRQFPVETMTDQDYGDNLMFLTYTNSQAEYQLQSLERAERGIGFNCCVLTFWPGPKCHWRWCTGRKWHIPIAVRRGNRVSGNWLMKWDELKKFPWYTHRLMHRKRVICELHDSYFCLMTIKHAISKIEWALNHYITQLSSSSSGVASWVAGSWQLSSSSGRVGEGDRRDVVGKAIPGRGGPRKALVSWGPEKMVIRYSKESHHPAEWARGPRLSCPKERERHNADGHKFLGQNITVYVRSPAPSHSKTPHNLFEPLQ